MGAHRMHIIKTHVIIMQLYVLLFLWLRTLGFDLARLKHKLIINNQETL